MAESYANKISEDNNKYNDSHNTMVEIDNNECKTENWDGGSYSDAMNKFRDTCLGNKDLDGAETQKFVPDKHMTNLDDEKENENKNGDKMTDGDIVGVGVNSLAKRNKDGDFEVGHRKGSFVIENKIDKTAKGKNEVDNEIYSGHNYHPGYGKHFKNGELNENPFDKYSRRVNIDVMQDQLTEKNVKLFTKMQYYNQNMDISKAFNSANDHKSRLHKHNESNVESDCPSPDGSLDEAHKSKKNFDRDLPNLKSHNPHLMKALLGSKSDMMSFAEVLYKCTLCSSIPSILTSKSSFIKHVSEKHLTVDNYFKVCKICFLKFRTEEDLRRHIVCIHTGNDRLSPLETGSDVIKSELFCNTVDNESDSDSSGHRSYKAKVAKRSKPHVPDFDSPKQLVDHAGIETLNGSLDLSKKDLKSPSNKCDANATIYNTPPDRSSPRSLSEKSALNVQQITDQIMKSNLQGRSINSQSENRVPLTPSYTPEFGKYTKLVREGGNIVYFCQVCNWMSPVKAHFQAHCGSLAHTKKVKATNEQQQQDQSDVINSDNCNMKDCGAQNQNPNVSIGNYDTKYGSSSPHPNILNIPNTSSLSKLHESNMYYSYIRPRTMTHCGRTPVVSGHGFQERSDMMYRKQLENSGLSLNVPFRKRKRPTSTKGVSHTSVRHSNSESDSDDASADKENPNVPRCSTTNMSLLRHKLLQGHSKHEGEGSYKEEIDSKYCFEEKLDIDVDKAMKGENESEVSKDVSLTNKRKQPADVSHGPDLPEKHRKETDTELNNRNIEDSDHTLFKLYRCMSCSFEYSNLEEYEQHFSKVHINSGQGQGDGSSQSTFQRLFANIGGGMSGQGQGEGQGNRNSDLNGSGSNMEMGENWRVQRLKEILPDFLEVNEKGNTSRDYLLQCISISAGIPDAALWSSACNKAVREIFPSSLAQRKGKYKKTYYFGLSMLETFQGQEDVTALEADGQIYQPIRDINADMEKIMEQLPSIIHWNGCMDSGVYRADILSVLSDIIEEQDVLNWGTQCNRAIKLVFPMVDMKRKGKFKTTKYFGVSFNKNIGQMPGKPDCNSNVADISNTKETKQDKTVEDNDDSSRETTLVPPDVKDNNNPSKDLNREPTETETAGNLVPVFPQWFKEEAESQMEQYLTKFGGVFDETSGKINEKTEDEDNDGDDEGESVDDTSAC